MIIGLIDWSIDRSSIENIKKITLWFIDGCIDWLMFWFGIRLIDWFRFDGYPWYIYGGDTENDEWELWIFSDNFPTLKPYLQVNHYPDRFTSISSVGTYYNLLDIFILVIRPRNKSPLYDYHPGNWIKIKLIRRLTKGRDQTLISISTTQQFQAQ